MCVNPRSRLVQMELEATPGTAETPVVGTNDIYVLDDSPGITIANAVIDNDPASPTGWQISRTTGAIKPTATYRWAAYMTGKTTGVVNLPRWLSTILQSCGFINQYLGGPTFGSVMEWTPDGIYSRLTNTSNVTSAARRTMTIYDYIGRDGGETSGTKYLWVMKGSMVSKLTITIVTGQLVIFEVVMLGQYVDPSAVTTDLSAFNIVATSNFYTPLAAGQQFTFANSDVYAMRSSSTTFEIDFGAAHIEGDTATGWGVACVERKQAKISVSTNPIVLGTRFDQMIAAQRNQEALAYALTGSLTPQGLSADTGYTIKPSAPAVQITHELDRGDTLRHNVQGMLVSPDGSTPPFKLTFT